MLEKPLKWRLINEKRCLIGQKYKEEISELEKLGFNVVKIPCNPNLDDEINNHTDILIFTCNNRNLIVDSLIAGEIKNFLPDYNVISSNNIMSPYPNDIKLNAAQLGDKIFCNSKYVAKEIVDYSNKNKLNLVHTNQGYTKCNMCVLNNNAVITEDYGLSCLLKKSQIDVLLIEKGKAYLSDKHYGFIGGAGCLISQTKMYFSGDISNHPDYLKIKEFLSKYNIEPVYNKNRKLRDFGGLIIIE